MLDDEKVETNTEVTETQETPPEPIAPVAPIDNDAERNFRLMRQERDEFKRRLQEIEVQKTRPVVPAQEDEDLSVNIPDGDLPEGKDIAKLQKQIRKLGEEVKASKKESVLVNSQALIQGEFPDFKKVVNKENLKTLEELEPEVYAALDASPDYYTAAKAAYKVLKKYGIGKEDVNVEEKTKAIQNIAKPRPVASFASQQGTTPLSMANAFANGLTDDMKKSLYEEMQKFKGEL